MELLEKYLHKNKILFRVWFYSIAAKFTLSFIFFIIAVATSPLSNWWIFEFLSLTKGVKNSYNVDPYILATIYTPIHAFISIIEFYYGYRLFTYTLKIQNIENREVMIKLRKKMKIILIGCFTTVFLQILWGLAWYLVSTFICLVKYTYIKEINLLKERKTTFSIKETAKALKESLISFK